MSFDKIIDLFQELKSLDISTPSDVSHGFELSSNLINLIASHKKYILSLESATLAKVRKLKEALEKVDLQYPILDRQGDRILRVTNISENSIFVKFDSQAIPIEYDLLTGTRLDGKSDYKINPRDCLMLWDRYIKSLMED